MGHNERTEKLAADDQEKAYDRPKSELNPTESVIKRSKPKNTKAAPAVVAIPMAELLGVSDDNADTDVKGLACQVDHLKQDEDHSTNAEVEPTDCKNHGHSDLNKQESSDQDIKKDLELHQLSGQEEKLKLEKELEQQ